MSKFTLRIGVYGLILAFCLQAGAQTSNFTDSRDGKKYRFVKIGNNTWMAVTLCVILGTEAHLFVRPFFKFNNERINKNREHC